MALFGDDAGKTEKPTPSRLQEVRNRGDSPLNWCDQASGCAPGAGTEDHPVIAQNLYRLKDGRFEQIGMSWLKHGFTSTNSTTAGCTSASGGSCVSPPAGGN